MNTGIEVLRLIVSICQIHYVGSSYEQQKCIKELIVCVENRPEEPKEWALQECLKK